MESIYYIGLDVHKKSVAYCIKLGDGSKVSSGTVAARRTALGKWARTIPGPWIGAMEATIFTAWIYDFLKPVAQDIKVAHPQMLKAITAAKKKNDRADAEKLADLLRADLLPECHMASEEIRELRRILRYRNLVVRMAVKTKNKMSGLLMEVGADYSKQRLHGQQYFAQLLEEVEDVPDSVIELLKLSRASLEMFQAAQRRLLNELKQDPLIRERVRRLRTIDGVSEVTALTWVLEVGDPARFSSIVSAGAKLPLNSGIICPPS